MTLRNRHAILLAICGTSPAVITETVQAVYCKYSDIVIDEVIVVTTMTGREKLVAQIIRSGAWNSLKAELKAEADTLRFEDDDDSIRIIPSLDKTRNLDDICSPEDHLSMANQLYGLFKEVADNPDITVLASLAGGRKTMSTMMGLCFSMFARNQDKLFHVLVNEPFDGKLEPLFLFKPEKPVIHRLPNGQPISSCKAHIDLIEIPCVHLSRFFPQRPSRVPKDYSSMVRAADVVAATGARQIQLDLKTGNVTIGATTVLRGKEAPALFWVYWSVARATKENIALKTMDALCYYIKGQYEHFCLNRQICRPLRNSIECNRNNIGKCMAMLKRKLDEQGDPYGRYGIDKKESGLYRLNLDSRLIVLRDAEGIER